MADHVIAMDCFKTLDLSSRAHEVAQQFGRNYDRESRTAFGKCSPRMIKSIHAGEPAYSLLLQSSWQEQRVGSLLCSGYTDSRALSYFD